MVFCPDAVTARIYLQLKVFVLACLATLVGCLFFQSGDCYGKGLKLLTAGSHKPIPNTCQPVDCFFVIHKTSLFADLFAHFAKTLQNCLLNPQNRLFPHTPTVNSQWISRHPQADNVRTFTPAPA